MDTRPNHSMSEAEIAAIIIAAAALFYGLIRN